MAADVVVASGNPVKLAAARRGFETVFPGQAFAFAAHPAPSGVAAQPFGQEETIRGAEHRAREVREACPAARYWVGIEGGVEESPLGLVAGAWIVVLHAGAVGRGATARFLLPEPVASRVRGGEELGAAIDVVFGQTNSKQAGGAIGLLSGGALDRTGLYAQGVVAALLPLRSPELYGAGS
ncbi:MAG: inosine/xanthosine triphosphatase [Pseudomonadota bacterium]